MEMYQIGMSFPSQCKHFLYVGKTVNTYLSALNDKEVKLHYYIISMV